MEKILYLNYEWPPLGGGASPVSYEIAKRLAATGDFDIDVVTMGFKGLPADEELSSNLRVHRVKCWRSKKEICHPWEQLTYLFSGYKKCKELIAKNKYDICYCHFIIPTGVLALKLKKKFGLNYVITSHGSDVLGYNKRFKFIYPLIANRWRKIVKSAKILVTPSEFLQKRIKKIVSNANFQVIPNGIDESQFKPLAKEKKILVVARLFVNKGIQDFLDALKGLDLGEWSVEIVGDGPYREELERKCQANGLKDKVKFLGWIDNKDEKMKELYGRATIFVCPSYFENMSMVLLEALATGCYVLATNVGGNPEVVPAEGLFQAGSPKELQEKLQQLLAGEAIKPMTLPDKFKWDRVIERYQKVLYEQ